jgi:Ca-activated chloride channel family protein
VGAQLQSAAVGLAGRQTAIGDAIGVAVKRLRKLPAQARVLVLLTDGVNNAGDLSPRQAARIAKTAGVRIYTIGIGADHIEVPGPFGTQVVRPSAGLDADRLKSIASHTGGRFYRATGSGQLEAAYRDINALEPVVHHGRPLRPRHELFMWPLCGALALALAGAAWRRRRPRAEEVVA